MTSGANFDSKLVSALPMFSNMPISLIRFAPGVNPDTLPYAYALQARCLLAENLHDAEKEYAEAVLRRELDRLFAAQPDLTDAQRAVIARTMSRLSNQLLHQPRAALCSAA